MSITLLYNDSFIKKVSHKVRYLTKYYTDKKTNY